MDGVQGEVHGLGPQKWSMDRGPCFVYVQKIGPVLISQGR